MVKLCLVMRLDHHFLYKEIGSREGM
jgi:hypothetical protein